MARTRGAIPVNLADLLSAAAREEPEPSNETALDRLTRYIDRCERVLLFHKYQLAVARRALHLLTTNGPARDYSSCMDRLNEATEENFDQLTDIEATDTDELEE